MPRGGGRRSAAPMSRPAPARHAPPPARPAPPPAAHAPPAAAAPQGPGLMGQMMATAGGVAIGSAVGHTIGNMMSGGGGHERSEAPVEQAPPSQPYNHQQPLQKPCEFELDQFLNCTKNQDLSNCEAFNQILKECRTRYGY